MSAVAVAWARQQRCGGATLKSVLVAVALHADDKGQCWPSQSRLAEETELDRKTVRESLKALETAGLIHRERFDREDGSRGSDRLSLHLQGGDRGVGPHQAGPDARADHHHHEGAALTRALEARVRRLEDASPESLAGLVVLTASSPEGERALISEAERQGEIGPRDLVVTIKRFSWETNDARPTRTRNVAGQVRPILTDFAEPLGTPWLDDLEHREPARRA